MNNDLRKRIDTIERFFYTDLRINDVLGPNKEVKRPKVFDRIVKEQLKELKKLEPLVMDEAGIVTDREGANILMNAISEFEEMRDTQSVKAKPSPSLTKGAAEEKARFDKPGIFARAKIKFAEMLFGKTHESSQKESR